MLHNDVAQQRPGEKPASAPKTSQKSPRAQAQAKFKIPTLKRAGRQHEDIDAAGLRDGNRETTHIIRIHGRHSPPTRHSLRPLQQRHKARQIFCTTSPCSCHSLHETIPSGKDTCTPARSSDLSLVRNNNSFMHGMARPANLRPRSFSLNHQRCRRRRGHAMQHKQGQTAKER
jgi:hypothetical protein